jgi:tRNA (cytidine56-2'-O)-methyltransferase
MCDCALANGLDVDKPKVVAGALLHDIGRSITQDIRHASLGADLLRKEGWDQQVVAMVERHTGAGIDADEAHQLGLPKQDYTPQSLEEKIVAHADNLYSGAKRLTLAEVQAKYEAKGLEKAGAKIARLHLELTKLLGTDLETLPPQRLALDSAR